jgi:hypothetical protein
MRLSTTMSAEQISIYTDVGVRKVNKSITYFKQTGDINLSRLSVCGTKKVYYSYYASPASNTCWIAISYGTWAQQWEESWIFCMYWDLQSKPDCLHRRECHWLPNNQPWRSVGHTQWESDLHGPFLSGTMVSFTYNWMSSTTNRTNVSSSLATPTLKHGDGHHKTINMPADGGEPYMEPHLPHRKLLFLPQDTRICPTLVSIPLSSRTSLSL